MSTAREQLKSAYELKREAKIRRNKARLAALGLSTVKTAMASEVTRPSAGGGALGKAKAKRKRKRSPEAPLPLRAPSRRVRGEAPETRGLEGEAWIDRRTSARGLGARGGDGVGAEDAEEEDAEYETRRIAKYERLLAKHAMDGLKLPPRATYAHTVHRVLSMSQKALLNRTRAIERAQGVYAVLKMRMFAEVLILEGYDEVALEAEAALQRLLELPRFSGVAAQALGAKTKATTATAK
jgi:hypothetical protein